MDNEVVYVPFVEDGEWEFVGIDCDGDVKPIGDLSYAPVDGWK